MAATDLLVPQPLKAEVIFHDEAARTALIEQVEKSARTAAAAYDADTDLGRDGLRTVAYRVARSKTAVDDVRKAHTADLVKQKAEVDAAGRIIRERLEDLQEEIRRPLTEWEYAQRKRQDAHRDAIKEVMELSYGVNGLSSAAITARSEALSILNGRDWEEFEAEAAEAIVESAKILSDAFHAAQQAEKERAELEALRLEKAEREKAEAAAHAKQEAERRAQERKDREAKIAAEAAEQARREAQEALERAEAARLAAEENARQQAVDAERRATEAIAAAVEQERRNRLAREQAEQAAEAKRIADTVHRAQINGKIRGALIHECALTREESDMLIEAINNGLIPHLEIRY